MGMRTNKSRTYGAQSWLLYENPPNQKPQSRVTPNCQTKFLSASFPLVPTLPLFSGCLSQAPHCLVACHVQKCTSALNSLIEVRCKTLCVHPEGMFNWNPIRPQCGTAGEAEDSKVGLNPPSLALGPGAHDHLSPPLLTGLTFLICKWKFSPQC